MLSQPSNRRLISLTALALLGMLSPRARAEDWSSLGRGPSQARLSAERSGSGFGAGWSHTALPALDGPDRALPGSPAVADGYVVVATQANMIQALRERDGRLLWQVVAGGAVLGSPAIGNGLAYVMGSNQQLYALGLSDGSVQWQRPLASFGPAAPAVTEDAVYVPSAFPRTRVLRLTRETGELIWEAGEGVLTQSAMSSITVADDRLLVAEINGKLHSFAAADGTWQWSADSEGQSNVAAPLVVGDRVFLLRGGDRARMYAFALATGAPLAGWPLDLPLPAATAPGGPTNNRRVATSSLAGADGLLLLSVRTEDRQDRSGDGDIDAFIAEEEVLAVSADDRQVKWRVRLGRVDSADIEKLPGLAQIPTPAAYRDGSGQPLIAVASTLAPRLRVLAAATGEERAALTLPAPTRSSPLLANGRLVIATDAGTVHSFLSRANQAPQAPTLGLQPDSGDEVDTASLKLRWGAAVDPEGAPVRYEVRLDDDGEILRDWKLRVVTGDDIQELVPAARLPGGKTFSFAVRAQDRSGAYAPWSYAASFRTLDTPAVTVDGQPATSLTDAVGKARPGQTITLGAGTFPLAATLRLPPGATLQGAGPHLTVLRARNLPVGVAPGADSNLRQLTVTGARVGVQVDSAAGVRLQNVILRDNSEAGLAVTTTGSAEVISVTAARNGTGLRLDGPTHARNSLIWANDVGLQALAAALVDSRYNDVAGNRVEDWRNAKPGQHDLAQPVVFEPRNAGDPEDAGLRLKSDQPTTDKGDPTDEWVNEPSPNGGRINIGAFGNTPFAELSVAVLTEPPTPPAPPVPPGTEPETPSEPGAGGIRASGGGGLCALADARGRPDAGFLLVLATAWMLRRRRRRP